MTLANQHFLRQHGRNGIWSRFLVLQDPIANAALGSQGQFAWGGAASTRFWVDPKEELTCVFMTQFMPSSFYPIRRELKAVIYQALR